MCVLDHHFFGVRLWCVPGSLGERVHDVRLIINPCTHGVGG